MQFYLQPQAQFTYLGVNGGFTDSEGQRSVANPRRHSGKNPFCFA
ncbi:autotransporter outer membrane beta-barrel domain-containing protein [Neisseria gonorrhoeae]